jgi:hypothetical protein
VSSARTQPISQLVIVPADEIVVPELPDERPDK